MFCHIPFAHISVSLDGLVKHLSVIEEHFSEYLFFQKDAMNVVQLETKTAN